MTGPLELTALLPPGRAQAPPMTPHLAPNGFPQLQGPLCYRPRLEAAVVTTLQDQVFLERETGTINQNRDFRRKTESGRTINKINLRYR